MPLTVVSQPDARVGQNKYFALRVRADLTSERATQLAELVRRASAASAPSDAAVQLYVHDPLAADQLGKRIESVEGHLVAELDRKLLATAATQLQRAAQRAAGAPASVTLDLAARVHTLSKHHCNTQFVLRLFGALRTTPFFVLSKNPSRASAQQPPATSVPRGTGKSVSAARASARARKLRRRSTAAARVAAPSMWRELRTTLDKAFSATSALHAMIESRLGAAAVAAPSEPADPSGPVAIKSEPAPHAKSLTSGIGAALEESRAAVGEFAVFGVFGDAASDEGADVPMLRSPPHTSGAFEAPPQHQLLQSQPIEFDDVLESASGAFLTMPFNSLLLPIARP